MPHLLKNKIYLYLTEFFAGMSVMAVELGASRLLAPYFSSSQIVWTIIIGTIMIAMALGNIYGGRTADRDPNPDRLYRRILIAAVWIAMIPVLGKYVILGISAVLIFTVNANYLIWAAFAACMVIFVFPLFLLGTVTPSLAKYTMDNLEDNAGIVGMLGAANTVGSIIGTFVPTFLTIPAVGTSISFLIFAGILLVLALLYFISVRKKPGLSIAAILLFLLSCVLGWRSNFAFWKQDLLYEGESIYNYLQVEETDDSVILSTNVLFGVQSIMRKDASLTGMYYDYAMAAPMMAGIEEKTADQKPFEMLILGMGTGTYGSQCARYYPAMHIEGVEIDERFTQPQYTMVDTLQFPKVIKGMWRAVNSGPGMGGTAAIAHVDSLVRAHLKEDGVMVVNMNMRGDKEEGSITQYLSDTICAVFPSVWTADVRYSTNRELFAALKPGAMETFQRNVALCADPELRDMLMLVSSGLKTCEGGEHIMTDDRAPVELLGMRVIDDLIRDEISWVREIYDREGIQGVINSI